MRILWWVLVMSVSMPALAFNVGGSSRANFGAPATQEETQDAAPRTHTATTYSSRYKFDKGVQTQGVRTKPVEVSGSTQNDVSSNAVEEKTVTISIPKKGAKAESPQMEEKQNSAAAQSTPQTPVEIPPEASAAMSQLGQMQEMLQGLQKMTGGAGGGNAQGNSAGAMPAGMPDLSALMGGKAPGKK